MKQSELFKRFNIAINGEDGTSALEIVVWMSVMMVICGLLFVFTQTTMRFLRSAQENVGFHLPERKTWHIDPSPVTLNAAGNRIS